MSEKVKKNTGNGVYDKVDGGFMSKTICVFLFLIIAASGVAISSEKSEPVTNECGFIAIEPIRFFFHYQDFQTRLELHSSPARIWYNFQASDRTDRNTPIFVFFNGGPGSASSSGLMSMNTGRYTLDRTIDGGGDAFIPNPLPWTQMGHLLYIDARETGFSYNTMVNPADYMERWREFNAQNFNCFFDGADFVRVIIRFLARHPSLADHPVVIVGESYGGIRATTLLYLIHQYADLANGREMYQDPELSREIQIHFDRVFPDYSGRTVPPAVISRQFGHQVLIQACISFGHQIEVADTLLRQPGSLIYRLGEEIGIPYDGQTDPLTWVNNVAGRDYYIISKPAGWLNAFFAKGAFLLSFFEQLTRMTGCDLHALTDMYAVNRRQGYRLLDLEPQAGAADEKPRSAALNPTARALFLDPQLAAASHSAAERGDLSTIFGVLQPWDRYHMSLNSPANQAFHFYNIALLRGYETHYRDHRFGRMFLRNLLHIQTFITNAAFDLVVYSPAIPASLARHTDLVSAVEAIGPFHDGRPSELAIHYIPQAFPETPAAATRIIRFPYYNQSAHAVSLTQPQELWLDVRDWLGKTGINLTTEGGQ